MTTYLLSWDQTGLEACINVTEFEKQQVWDVLNDKPPVSIGSILNSLTLRARYNSQRHYEIYTVDMDDGITADDVREMFEQAPQEMVDLIRARGRKIYSDRADPAEIKIT